MLRFNSVHNLEKAYSVSKQYYTKNIFNSLFLKIILTNLEI